MDSNRNAVHSFKTPRTPNVLGLPLMSKLKLQLKESESGQQDNYEI